MAESSSINESVQEFSELRGKHSGLLPRVPEPPKHHPKTCESLPKPSKANPQISKPICKVPEKPPPQREPPPPSPPKSFWRYLIKDTEKVNPVLSTPEPPPKTIDMIQRHLKENVSESSTIDISSAKELTHHEGELMKHEVGDDVTEALEKECTPVTVTNIEAVLVTLLAGGIAGGVARTLTAPIDFSKRDYYVHHPHEPYSLMTGIRFIEETYKLKGIRVFYKANMFALVRVIPFAAIQFTAHKRWKNYLELKPDSPVRMRMAAGALAGVTALTLTYPIDLTLAQMYMLESDDINTFYKAFQHVWKRGGLRGLYRGYLPSIIGIIPYSGISFCTYDGLKHRFLTPTHKIPSLYFGVFGAFAGFLGQTAAYPLDVIRRHMQMATPLDTRFKTLTGTILAIFRTRGIRGFYEGLSINWIKGPISVGVSFATFDSVLEALKRPDEDFG